MNHEDTSKGNGSRGARHEYSLSGNVTWVHRPPCFFDTGGVDGCSFPVYPRVIASGSIMSIDEIFFFGGREEIRSSKGGGNGGRKKEIGRCL